LSGKYRRDAMPNEGRLTSQQRLIEKYLTEENWTLVERLRGFCERHEVCLLDVAFGWLLARSFVSSVIAGATRPEQVELNVRAGERALTPAQLDEIENLCRGDSAALVAQSGRAAPALTH
jgi:aryl-alcohol dehydrogenase-like predicted oxidoreductase